MKKILKEARGFVLGVLVCVLVMGFAVPAIAANMNQNINVSYRDIKLVINGQTITPKDASGTTVEPFIYNGTTYLPVRAVGEAIGYTVGWDNNTSTVTLTGAGSGNTTTDPVTPTTVNMIDTLGDPYSTDAPKLTVFTYPSTGSESVSLGGTSYKNAFTMQRQATSAISASFNLSGKYTMLSGKIGPVDGTGQGTEDPIVVNIYGDGNLLKTVDLAADALPTDFSVDVRGVSSLKFEVAADRGTALHVGFVDLKLQ